jgi:hypothetical protein
MFAWNHLLIVSWIVYYASPYVDAACHCTDLELTLVMQVLVCVKLNLKTVTHKCVYSL